MSERKRPEAARSEAQPSEVGKVASGQVETRGHRRVRVIVRGRVQGVAFRAYTADEARRAGIAGWVRNRPDGSVEAAFEGAPSAVEALLAFVRRGPRSARVQDVEAFEEPLAGDRLFEIRH